MVKDDGAEAVPELVRHMTMASCDHDPVPLQVAALVNTGIALGDVVADSGYAHRVPESFALPLRAAGASLVMDLHPHDRGTQGTHRGAICFDGNLYCPATPKALFDLTPLGRGASEEETAAHDDKVAELSRFKFGRVRATDPDGFHRVGCPAVTAKVRCPLWPPSMAASFERPEVLEPPGEPPACCTQQTITVPPSVNAKTAQRHDYTSAPWRRSYTRRSASERSNARIKDPATIDVGRGWCRAMGLAPMSLFVACALVVRNLAVAEAFERRREEDRRRAASGRPPRTRRRRRSTLTQLVGASTATSP